MCRPLTEQVQYSTYGTRLYSTWAHSTPVRIQPLLEQATGPFFISLDTRPDMLPYERTHMALKFAARARCRQPSWRPPPGARTVPDKKEKTQIDGSSALSQRPVHPRPVLATHRGKHMLN